MRDFSRWLLATTIALGLASSAYAVTPEFDRYFGQFAPPDYIPIDVASDAAGNIYVLDIYHERVRKFDNDGNFLLEMNFDFKWVRGIVIDSVGNIYIADAAGSTYGSLKGSSIIKFDASGAYITSWSAASRGIGISSDDRIYAASRVTDSVRIYDTDGNFLQEIGKGFLNDPEDVAVGPDGSIYVADALNARIVKFDAVGNIITSWGSWGSKPDQFNNPVSVSVDTNGNVFVTDRRNYKIKKFSSDGTLLATVGSQGQGPAQFEEPHGHTTDPFGNVWLATYHGQDIQKFDNNLNYILTIEGYRSGPGEFADVRGVDVDSERNVYVADKWNQRITKFDRDGNFLMAWGRRGQGEGPEFNFPRAVHIDADDNVYVSDDGHIRKFDKNGNYITRYGKYKYARGLATDRFDNLYIVEPLRNRIVKINQATGDTTFLGGTGSGPGQLLDPWGVAIGPNDRLYVTDQDNSRVQRLTLDGVYELEWGAAQPNGGELIIPTAISVDENGLVYVGDGRTDKILVYDADGLFIEEWGGTGTSPGQFSKIFSIGIESPSLIYAGDVGNVTVQKFTRPITINPEGRPSFVRGTDTGYFIGADTDGTWEVNWTSDSTRREFSGSIDCNQPISSATGIRYEANDTLTIAGNSLQFYGVARNGGDDGIRFVVSPTTQCNFDLYIDGENKSGFSYFGQAAQNPNSLPVMVQTPAPVIDPVGAPIYAKGSDLGVYMWYDTNDTIWKLRFSTDGANRLFTGSMRTDGTVTSATPVAWEAQDELVIGTQSVTFTAHTASHQDGINMKISGATTITLDVLIDGVQQRQKVFFGSSNHTPYALPITIDAP